MTQEFLAMMLCVHRPGVTIAARLFQQAGLIRYGQGHITITDRPGLEAAACECYGIVRDRFGLMYQLPPLILACTSGTILAARSRIGFFRRWPWRSIFYYPPPHVRSASPR